MSRFEHALVIDAPVREVYDQWTQFESFPKFMEGVESVDQVDDRTLDWTAELLGQRRSWRAVITDQTPDRRVAWKSVSGAQNAGAVLFESHGPDRTRVTLRMEVEPDGALDTIGDALGVVQRRTRGDLERFRDYLEQRGRPSGAWRGEIHGQHVQPDVEDESLSR